MDLYFAGCLLDLLIVIRLYMDLASSTTFMDFWPWICFCAAFTYTLDTKIQSFNLLYIIAPLS